MPCAAGCDGPLRFNVEQCLPNPIVFGSASVSFNCPRPGGASSGGGTGSTGGGSTSGGSGTGSGAGSGGVGSGTGSASGGDASTSDPASGSGSVNDPPSGSFVGGGNSLTGCTTQQFDVAMVNWFAKGDCTTDTTGVGRVTVVSADLGICHTVPATQGFSNSYAGYKVRTASHSFTHSLTYLLLLALTHSLTHSLTGNHLLLIRCRSAATRTAAVPSPSMTLTHAPVPATPPLSLAGCAAPLTPALAPRPSVWTASQRTRGVVSPPQHLTPPSLLQRGE